MLEILSNAVPYFFSALLGLIAGSFLNVVIYRTEKGRGIGGRSFCPHCRRQLPWQDNIPLLSFLILSGRCRFCRRKISRQYPLVEGATGVLFLGIVYFSLNNYWNDWLGHFFGVLGTKTLLEKVGVNVSLASLDAGWKFFELIFVFAVAAALIAIFVYDLKHMLIPDAYVIWGIIFSLAFNFVADIGLFIGILASKNQILILKIKEYAAGLAGLRVIPPGFLETFWLAPADFYARAIHLKALFFTPAEYPYLSLLAESRTFAGLAAGIFAAGFFYFIVWVSRETWMGRGDVQLAFLLGLFLGVGKTLVALFFAFQTGAVVGLVLMLFGRAQMKTALPFGPFLILGAFLSLLFP
ncbi:MAG: prepilin peptidase [Candidatus Moranbacteria bacterium]|nr:prepilin peptidase [Candidatus Moranbacteria bacterium]